MRKIKTPHDVRPTKMKKSRDIKTRPTTLGDVKSVSIPPRTVRNIPNINVIRGTRDIVRIDKQPWEEKVAEAMHGIGKQRFHLANRIYFTLDRVKKLLADVRISNEELQASSEEMEASNEELRSTNEELESRTAELEFMKKEIESFSYSVSHDLRAPLRSIDGFSQALLEDYADKLNEQGKDYLQRLRAAAQHMGKLIDDMLRLSRVTRDKMEIETVDLSALAQMIAAELQGTQPERQAEFVVAPGITVQGDARLLRIALENLLGNAWKFTGKRPRARIELGVTLQEGKPVYFVRDDGAGFNMAYADKLFVVFQRLHTEAEFPGIGIGLAIVNRIIHRHGGRIWAEGAVEKGATFYFTM